MALTGGWTTRSVAAPAEDLLAEPDAGL